MKYLPLVWRNLTRKKLRTGFTLLSIVISFVIFAYLAAINTAFALGVDVTGEDRLLVKNKITLLLPLPESYQSRLEAIPGVVEVAHATWFGGKYQDNFEGRFGIFPVQPERYLKLYPEFLIPDVERENWFKNRTGALVGRKTANDFGWKVGDRIPIQGTIFRIAGGGDTWEFTIDAIYDGKEKGVDETLFLLHYDYFDEAREERHRDLVGWYVLRIEDPAEGAEVVRRIDERFENSPYETETTTEKAFVQGFAEQIGNIGAIIRAVLTAVFFTMLLVVGNTMAQSVRERTNELAVLKTLGYSDFKVLGLVLAESLVLSGLGGAIGLAGGWLLVGAGDPTGGQLPLFFIPTGDMLIGGLVVIALGLVTGLLPSLQAKRLKIVDALRSA